MARLDPVCAQLLMQLEHLSQHAQADHIGQAYQAICQQFPHYHEPYHCFALWLTQRPNGHGLALDVLRSCRLKTPPHPDTDYLIGRMFEELSQLDEAVLAYQNCLMLAPNHSKARFHLGLADLTRAQFEPAMAHFDERLRPDERHRLAQHPRWMPGMRCSDVLIWAEQGIGDEIMFSRLFHYLPQSDAEFTLACDQRLLALFQWNFPRLRFVSREQGRAMKPAAHAPMGDLLRWYHRDLATPQVADQRLVPPAASATGTHDALRTDRVTIGVSWLSMNAESGAHRSIQLGQLCRHLSPQRHQLVCLQYLAPDAELATLRERGFDIHHPADPFNQLVDLSHWILKCDRVLTIDNVTAHLAGALGAPTDVLLPKLPNWRWGLDAEQSYWYRSVRLLRQKTAGDWGEVLSRL